MNRYPANLLERRFAYESWRERTNLDANLLIWNFSFAGSDLRGWQPQDIRARKPALAATDALTTIPDTEPVKPQAEVQSIWQPESEQDDLRVGVNVLECRSRAEAHQLLLSLLGELQSPLVQQLERPDVGDVAFAVPGETLLIFARGNLVVVIRNVGRMVASVMEVAQQVDRRLVSVPGEPDRSVGARFQRMTMEPDQLDAEGSTPLELSDLPLRAAEPPMVKFRSRTGQVVLEDGQPVYHPESSGVQELEVYVERPADTSYGEGSR
ncbi:MAG: hypothetical protein ACK2U9_23630 [Anaerolineae bacterium]